MENNQKATMKPKTKKFLIIIAVVMAVLLLVCLVVYIVVNVFLNSIGRVDPDAVYGSKDPAAVFQNGEPIENLPANGQAEELFAGKNVINILLVGQDRREGEEEGPQRTDAMLLCTFDKDKKTVTLTSFLPDLWVYIPNLYNQRLNIPYKLGGFPLLNDTLEYNFGVRADYNIEMDFAGFMKAVDLVGGVTIQLTAAEAKYLNQRGNWDIEENQQWQLREGENLLNGSQTLAYTRIKHLGTDFGRANRQSTVMIALAKKLEGISSADLYDISREIFPLLCTDMTNNQMLQLLLQLLPLISELKIQSQTIPLSGQYQYEKKGEFDVLVLNKDQFEISKQLLRETIRSK